MEETTKKVLLPLPILYESDDFFSEVSKICDIIPLSTLVKILELHPDAKFELFQVTNIIKDDKSTGESIDITYARIRKHQEMPEETKKVDWRGYFGIVKDQKSHDICWAIVTVELVKAIRWIRGRDQTGIDYSYQELVDFVDPERRKTIKRKGHFCYTLNITKALSYIADNGIQREVERPFVNCRAFPPPLVLTPDLGFIGAGKRISTIEEALIQLQKHPLGAAFPMFFPDYYEIKEIYRGPMYKDSTFGGMHAVSITGAGIENGESFMWVRSSHGERIGINGYFRVSIDVMIFRTSEECQKYEENYFITPTPLLTRFSYPELLEENEENKRKRKIRKQIANIMKRKGSTSN